MVWTAWREALRAQLITAMESTHGSLMSIPKLECVVDELAVLGQRTDHGMIAQEWQHLLFRSLGA